MAFNKEMVQTILAKCQNLSLAEQVSRSDGRFLADKSYGFDTMFFVTRYIQRFRFGDLYKRDRKDRENEYIRDLFCLREASQVVNYFTEVLALLRFLHAVEIVNADTYRIIDEDIMEIYSSSFENAYIFHYLLCYSIFNKHDLWELYLSFCNASDVDEKQAIYSTYIERYASIDARIHDITKQWALFTPKYPMVVLNYANRQNMVARTGNVATSIVTRTDIALNVKGNRANLETQKKNTYLSDLSESYIIETIRPFLAVEIGKFDKIAYTDSFSVEVADTKLDMLAARDGVDTPKRKSQSNKYKYVGGTRTRTVQGEFRSGLLQKTPHVCPICGFSFEDFLIASHIKPYAKCEDTYDAMNPNNGLLMCPVCDKLFESANYITIEPQTGKVIYIDKIETAKDLQYLHDVTIKYDYIDCERRHYIKWHYDYFMQKHGDHCSI